MKSVKVAFIVAVAAVSGCGSGVSPPTNSTSRPVAATPEDAYREFFLAMLVADEVSIRNLIIDHPGAETFWRDTYPKEVAALLAEQYRTMEIVRADGAEADRVILNSTACPLPLTVQKIGETWKVNVGPLIKARQQIKAT